MEIVKLNKESEQQQNQNTPYPLHPSSSSTLELLKEREILAGGRRLIEVYLKQIKKEKI